MPYANEHAARLRDPGDFKEKPDWSDDGKFRRSSDGTLYGKLKVPETIDVLWGQLKSQSGKAAAPQSLRFATKDWTAEAAKEWLKKNNVNYLRFEPAKKEGEEQRYEYPAEAFYFACGTLDLADVDGDPAEVPMRILARSSKAIETRYWGNIVHDLEGMHRKESVPVDYLHDHEQVIGYLDRFQVQPDGLHAVGALVPYGTEDKASEIIYRGQHGVPWEASIFWGGNGIKIEELSINSSAEVNGQVVHGPAVIVREWPLRGVAICPYGADQYTRTEFSQSEQISVQVISKEEEFQMTNQEKVSQPVDQLQDPSGLVSRLAHGFAKLLGFDGEPSGQLAQQAGDGLEVASQGAGNDTSASPQAGKQAAAEKPDGAAFLEAFGVRGAVWFAEGKTFEEARVCYYEELKALNTALNNTVTELRRKLAAVDRGEEEPAEFQVDPKEGASQKARDSSAVDLGGRRARMAQLMQQYMPN